MRHRDGGRSCTRARLNPQLTKRHPREDHRDLGDLRGKRVLVRSDLNVPLDGLDHHRRRPHPRVGPDDQGPGRGRRPRHRLRPPRPAQGRARGQVLPRAGREAPRRGARQPTSPSPRTPWGTTPRPRPRPLEDGQVLLLENLRFNAGETAKTDEERAEFAGELASLADVFVSDGFGVVHRKQASVYDVARLLPHADGRARVDRGRRAHRLTQDPSGRMPSCSGARRCPTSSASSATSSAPPTASSSAAAWSSPSSRPRATRSARACSRPTRSTRSRATSTAAEKRGRRDRPARRHRRRRRVLRRRRPRGRRGRRDPGRPDGPRHRTRVQRALRREARRLPHRLLERPDGRVRDGAVCRRHQGARRRPSSR